MIANLPPHGKFWHLQEDGRQTSFATRHCQLAAFRTTGALRRDNRTPGVLVGPQWELARRLTEWAQMLSPQQREVRRHQA